MIELTRLNGHAIAVNCDLIKFVEATPDTTLSLVSGERLIVLETPAEVVARVRALRSAILKDAWQDGAPLCAGRPASGLASGSPRS